MVGIPASITDLIALARDRKELQSTAVKERNHTAMVTKTDDLKLDNNERHPLQPYKRIAGEEYHKLSRVEKDARRRHNDNIEKAGQALQN